MSKLSLLDEQQVCWISYLKWWISASKMIKNDEYLHQKWCFLNTGREHATRAGDPAALCDLFSLFPSSSPLHISFIVPWFCLILGEQRLIWGWKRSDLGENDPIFVKTIRFSWKNGWFLGGKRQASTRFSARCTATGRRVFVCPLYTGPLLGLFVCCFVLFLYCFDAVFVLKWWILLNFVRTTGTST